MQSGKRTIKEIAQMAGVSPTAVSFVLNGKGGVGEETRKRVMRIIQETGFQPSAASQRLARNKSYNLAVMYPQTASPFSDLFYYEIADGIIALASDYKYNVVFSPLETRGGRVELPGIIRRSDVDGVVFLQETDPVFLSRPEVSSIPHVMVDLHTPELHHTCVNIDAGKSMAQMVGYVRSRGHLRIAFLGDDLNQGYYTRCFFGYQQAMMGGPVYPHWIQQAGEQPESVEACVDGFLSSEPCPTALCCTSDMLAVHAMRAIRSRGKSIPGDISVTGIDDILLSRYVEPALTTVTFDKREIGRLAGSLLMDSIAGKPVKSIIVKSDSIVMRNSVADV